MANKELTAKVKLDVRDIDKKLRTLETRIKRIQEVADGHKSGRGLEKSIERQLRGAEKVKQETLKTQIAEQKLEAQKIRTAMVAERQRQTQEKINQAQQSTASIAADAFGMFKKQDTVLGSIWRKVKQIASTWLGLSGAKLALQTTDTITSAKNKLNYVNGYDGKATKASMDKMYASAQKVRMGYGDMMNNVSKSMALAGDAFGGNVDNAIRFQEIMAEAYAVGGASAQEMSTSMYQLIQALGSGTLAGDELRSVREGAPLAYKELEKFAQQVHDTDDSLKDMAADGLITSEMVVAGIMKSGQAMDEAFSKTEQTFAQTWTKIKNTAMYAFTPIAEQLQTMLQEAIDNGLLEKLQGAFVKIAGFLQQVIQIVWDTINWIADNWSWLKNVIVGVFMLLVAWQVIVKIYAIASAIATKIAWWEALDETEKKTWSSMYKIMGIIGTVVLAIFALCYVWYLFADGAISLNQAIAWSILIIGAAVVIIMLLLHVAVNWWIVAIVALIAIAIMFFDYFCGLICVVGAFIYNAIVGLINAIIQLIWSRFVEPFIGIIEWILNVCQGGFDSFGDAVANLIGQIISWFLSLGKIVTTIIDAIFGTDWTGGLTSLQEKVTSWGKNENAITLSREAPTIKRIAYTDAWNTGYNFGSQFTGFKLEGGSNGGNDNKLKFPNFNDDAFDVSKSYNFPTNDELLNGVGDTADNTGKMADSMELANEDLEYLRKIAAMEWKKEFTTANITVDMSNYNTINSDSDLDGIVTKLSEKLTEELNAVANGVYA